VKKYENWSTFAEVVVKNSSGLLFRRHCVRNSDWIQVQLWQINRSPIYYYYYYYLLLFIIIYYYTDNVVVWLS